MKRIFLASFIFLAFIFLCTQNVSAVNDLKAGALQKLQREVIKALPVETDIVRIAVLDFEGDNGTVKDAITSAITEKTTFKVIEREDLDKILKEQGLQLKDIMDEKTRIQLGKIKGVQGLLMGKVLNMDKGFMTYNIKVHLKLDDVEKGEIVVSKDFSVSAVSPARQWLIFGVIGIIVIMLAISMVTKRRTTVIKEDLVARIDISKEIDKAVTNISGARSKMNSKGKTDEAIMLNNVEGDLLNIKQLVQTASRGSAYKTNTKDYENVLKFDQNIMSSFESLRKSSDRIYEIAISGNTGNFEKEIDILKRDIKNTLNEFRDRGF
jgi:curli biogenesis system outer membrane secretion channel CsgG